MGWDHRSKIVAVGITIQPVLGLFNAPTAADILGVSNVTNADEPITAQDPTMTGAIWEQPRIYLGRTGSGNFTVPMRGPGGAAPPLANAWIMGRIFQAAGMPELRNAAAITANLAAGSTTNALMLDAAQSAVDGFYTGCPIQHANIGAGFKSTTMISAYAGAAKQATISESMGVAPAAGTPFTIPPFLGYQLGTMSSAPPLLSISIWRDKIRYDYKDCRLTALGFDIPVSNEAAQVYPAIDPSFKGTPCGRAQDVAPVLSNAALIPVPPYRGGKFHLDRIMLGHASVKSGAAMEVAAPSNANAAEGQDGYMITSGSRSIELDINQMDIADFDFETRLNNQTTMPLQSTWGLGAGNRFGFVIPGLSLDPLNPGDRNGFVNLTGNAHIMNIDKGFAFACWW